MLVYAALVLVCLLWLLHSEPDLEPDRLLFLATSAASNVGLAHDPVTGARNLGLYRLHLYDATTTGMHWQIQKGGGFHYHEAEKRGRGLEVAVHVGADPATLLAAVSPLPEGIDELAFAGFLRGASTRLVPARSLAMDVLADAEFVIEGFVPPRERREEGPFGDHFGHYSHAAPFPVFHVRNVTHRRRAIFPATVVGKPPQEDKFMGEAVQEMFTGILRVIHPEIRDLWAYFEAGFHNLLVVAVENRFAREARKTALGLFGTGQLSLTKAIVLVDAEVNPRDRAAVFGAIAYRVAGNAHDCSWINFEALLQNGYRSFRQRREAGCESVQRIRTWADYHRWPALAAWQCRRRQRW
jgi:4-hydroxy-3-polyprenylbenzoate decarboxylase